MVEAKFNFKISSFKSDNGKENLKNQRISQHKGVAIKMVYTTHPNGDRN